VVEVLPEVNLDALHAAASSGRTVVISLTDMPVPQAWRIFLTLARDTTGGNEVRVRTPEGELTLPFASGLDLSHLGAVAALLPGASMRYEAHTAPAELVDGLLEEGHDHAERRQLEDTQRALVEQLGVPTYELPRMPGGVDLAGLYELAELLREEGLG